MTSHGMLLALACAVLLGACQSNPSGYVERQCEASGLARDVEAFRNCVQTTYAQDRAFANRYMDGGP